MSAPGFRPAPPPQHAIVLCSICGTPKPPEEFRRAHLRQDGRIGRCRACMRRRRRIEKREQAAALELLHALNDNRTQHEHTEQGDVDA